MWLKCLWSLSIGRADQFSSIQFNSGIVPRILLDHMSTPLHVSSHLSLIWPGHPIMVVAANVVLSGEFLTTASTSVSHFEHLLPSICDASRPELLVQKTSVTSSDPKAAEFLKFRPCDQLLQNIPVLEVMHLWNV